MFLSSTPCVAGAYLIKLLVYVNLSVSFIYLAKRTIAWCGLLCDVRDCLLQSTVCKQQQKNPQKNKNKKRKMANLGITVESPFCIRSCSSLWLCGVFFFHLNFFRFTWITSCCSVSDRNVWNGELFLFLKSAIEADGKETRAVTKWGCFCQFFIS